MGLVIRDILRHGGLQFCVPGFPEASHAKFDVIGTYLDNFLLKFESSLSPRPQALDVMARNYLRVPSFPARSFDQGHDLPPPQRPQLPMDGSAGFEVITSDASIGVGDVYRVLFRLDNTSSAGAVNKGASPHPDSLALLMWLLDFPERFDIELIARHIPGRENTLADCFSRLCGAINCQQWRLLVDIFRALEAACGPIDVGACSDHSCSDPLGRNSVFPDS
eukprot:jgi/Tetstr1/429698/TSEL_019593.t1